MAKKLVSFVVGVLVSSAWWSIAVWPPWGDRQPGEFYPWPIIPALATIAFAVLAMSQVVVHWNDK